MSRSRQDGKEERSTGRSVSFLGSLHSRLLSAFLLVTVIPLGLLVLISNQAMRTSLTDAAYFSLSAASSRTAVGLDAFVSTNLTILKTEARLPILNGYLRLTEAERLTTQVEASIRSALASFGDRDPVFIGSYALLDIHGRNLVDIKLEDEGDESKRSYFTQALESDLPYVSPVEFSANDGRAYLYFSAPIHNTSGVAVGVLRVRYDAAVLQQLIAESSGLLGSSSFAMLIDDHRLLLAHGIAPHAGASSMLYARLGELSTRDAERLMAARRIPARSTDRVDEADLVRNLDHLHADKPYFTCQLRMGARGDELAAVAVSRMRLLPWTVVYSQPQKVFLAPVEAEIREILSMALGVVAAIVVIATIAARSLSHPIERLTRSAGQLAMGDFSIKMERTARGELGVLESAFRRMAEEIQRLVGDLAERNQQLLAANEALSQQNHLLESEIAERARTEVILREQQAAIRALSTPIIAVWNGVLALPIIGVMDAERAAQMMEKLLEEMTQTHASIAILDLTGVERVDRPTAEHLMHIVRAAKLLGGRCVLSGISPAIARAMVDLDIARSDFVTFRTLQSALRHAIGHAQTGGLEPPEPRLGERKEEGGH